MVRLTAILRSWLLPRAVPGKLSLMRSIKGRLRQEGDGLGLASLPTLKDPAGGPYEFLEIWAEHLNRTAGCGDDPQPSG